MSTKPCTCTWYAVVSAASAVTLTVVWRWRVCTADRWHERRAIVSHVMANKPARLCDKPVVFTLSVRFTDGVFCCRDNNACVSNGHKHSASVSEMWGWIWLGTKSADATDRQVLASGAGSSARFHPHLCRVYRHQSRQVSNSHNNSSLFFGTNCVNFVKIYENNVFLKNRTQRLLLQVTDMSSCGQKIIDQKIIAICYR